MSLASDGRAIARAAIQAVDPGPAVERNLAVRGGSLRIGRHRRPLPAPATVWLVAIGKAAGRMIDAAARQLGDRVGGGLAITREQDPAPRADVEHLAGEHPVPGEGSVRAGRRARDLVARRSPEESVLFLISGGGSALVEIPPPDLSLAELARTSELLLGCGAPIQAMNAVRRHLSSVKGGGLARATAAGGYATLAISDVVGDDPWEIASGPTVADPTTFADALSVTERYGIARSLPPAALRHLREGARGRIGETAKPGERAVARGTFTLVARNIDALRGAGRAASRLGYRPRILGSGITGDTQEVARVHAALLRAVVTREGTARPPACLISGGETTVTLPAHPGRGGRNQEFVLACAEPIAGLPGALVLSCGTDGIDGPTDAAGGWVDGRTWERARRLGVDIARALRVHDAYPALERLGSLLRTGPTGTNVTDLHLLIAGRRPGRGRSSRPRGAPSSRRRRS